MTTNLTKAALLAIGFGVLAVPSAIAVPAQIGATCDSSSRIPNSQWTTCESLTEATYTFFSAGPGTPYSLSMTAPSGHCSSVSYQVWSRGGAMLGKTQRFLNAGEREVVGIGSGFPAGNNTVVIRAIGQMGGCNVGAMHSWGAIVDVAVIAVPVLPSATPAAPTAVPVRPPVAQPVQQ
ncbi:MAG: hypothetical protein ACK55V_08580 [Alphaproteobacteria bacterium]